MNRIHKSSTNLAIFFFMLTGSLLGLSLFDHGSASASCGVQSGNIHDYAGLVVSSRYLDYEFNSMQPSNNTRVTVTTSGATTTPPGGIINLNNMQHHAAQTFSQIGGCDFLPGSDGSDRTNVVLGRGGSSPDSASGQRNWALDCDNSKRKARPELSEFQKFDITGVGVPDGARPLRTGFGSAEGYGWDVRTVAPPNGDTTFVTITYKEPPPPPPITEDRTPDGNMQFDCNQVYGYSSNRNKRYKLFVNSVSGNNEIARGATGPSEGRYGGPIAGTTAGGANYDGRGGGVTFIIRIYAGNEDTTSVIQEITNVSNAQDCVDDPPAHSISSMTCQGISINVSDPDDQGVGVYYELYIYQDNDGSKQTMQSGRGSGIIDFNYPEESAPNNGWKADLIVKNLQLNQTDGAVSAVVSAQVGACYTATCDIPSITATTGAIPGASPSDGVAAGKDFNVNYTLTNTGDGDNNPLYPQIGSAPLTLTTTSATSGAFTPAPYYTVGQQVEVGATVSGSFAFTAPATAGRHTIEFYPDYNGLFAIQESPTSGAVRTCAITVDVFQPFQIKPIAEYVTPTPGPEDPTSIEYGTRVERTSGPGPMGIPYFTGGVLVAGNNKLNYLRHAPTPSTAVAIAGAPLDNDPINNAGKDKNGALNQSNSWQRLWNRTYFNPAAQNEFRPGDRWNPGDQFCARIDITYNQGWTNGQPYPGAARVIGTSYVAAAGFPNYDIKCDQVVNTPYMKAYGNDIVSGGTALGSGSIKGFMADPAQGAGSGVEFAAVSASSPIDFATAFYRNAFAGASPAVAGRPQSPNDLKLANVLRPGGQPKYYDETIKRETKEGPVSGYSAVQGASLPSPKNNNQSRHTGGTLSGGGGTFTGRHTMYVDGNVIINGNIVYGPTGATIDTIPAFVLIVKGDIYISDSVTQLDGMYISQGGTIHTCTDNGRPLNLATAGDKEILAQRCSVNQLRMNGVLVSDKIKFYRTKNTLRDIKYNVSGGARYYTPRESFDGVGQVPANPTKAGEAIRMTPEVMLGQYGSASSFRSQGSQTGNKYEYIVTLPPIL